MQCFLPSVKYFVRDRQVALVQHNRQYVAIYVCRLTIAGNH